jgi:hypothetical protein
LNFFFFLGNNNEKNFRPHSTSIPRQNGFTARATKTFETFKKMPDLILKFISGEKKKLFDAQFLCLSQTRFHVTFLLYDIALSFDQELQGVTFSPTFRRNFRRQCVFRHFQLKN